LDDPIVISKNLKFDLPVVIPSMAQGHGSSSKLVKYSLDLKYAGRIGGRALGDNAIPPLMAVGLVISVLPNQVEDWLTGASGNEYVGDAIVDVTGFGVSEAFGDLAAVFAFEAGLGPGAIVANYAADFVASLTWDNAMENGGRQATVEKVGQLATDLAATLSVMAPQNHYPQPLLTSPRPSEQIINPIGTPNRSFP
jgi:hypothetical protein